MSRPLHPFVRLALGLGALTPLALVLACSGGTGTATGAPPVQNAGSVGMVLTDAPTDTWSNIGVVIRKVELVPQGGSLEAAVQIYDGATDGAQVNLVHLDDLSELLKTATGIPAGSYDRVVVRVDGNPANITLVPALDAGGTSQAPIPAGQIQVGGVKDANGWVALPGLRLESPLVVTAGQTTALQLDFDLAHPLFIVVHDVRMGLPIYTVNFQIHPKPHGTLARLNLRPLRGQVGSVAADAKSLVLHTVHGKDVTLLTDTANQTLFYDLDAAPGASAASAMVPAGLTAGKFAKAAARFQNDGSLTAVRVWFSADAAKLDRGTPEGHLVRVEPAAIRVLTEDGRPVTIGIEAGTTFTFQGGPAPIGTGPGFLTHLNRGFKVQVSLVDPQATAWVARTVDIQRGVFEGDFTAADPVSGFTYRKAFGPAELETHALGYDSSFTWWNFAYPTVSSSDKVAFAAKAMPAGGLLRSRGMSTVNWVNGDWAAQTAIFGPTQLSNRAQTITTAYGSGSLGVSYTPEGGAPAATVTVNLATVIGSQPLVTEFTWGTHAVTSVPLDSSQWAAKLTAGSKVRVFGIPRADGSLDAYVVNLFD